ncbi:MAG: ArsR family transcriptional regulator [Magnetospirillum sp.]|nr:ArsR family transcriptional regulator [Magnetospirillum sp.]
MEESIRLAVLRFLEEDTDYSLNTSILQDALEQIGFGLSRDQVETICAWLEEQCLVSIEKVMSVTVVKLTPRGAEVAAGRARVPGVKRPSPRG